MARMKRALPFLPEAQQVASNIASNLAVHLQPFIAVRSIRGKVSLIARGVGVSATIPRPDTSVSNNCADDFNLLRPR